MSQANHWCWTFNNPEEEPEVFGARIMETGKVRYIVFQLERGEQGTLHWQGYVELTRSQRLTWLKNNISNTAHFEKRQGTRKQARDYCMKDDSREQGPWEYGDWRSGGRGRRNDITAFKDAIASGKRKRELIDEYDHEMCKYPKFYETVRALKRPKREADDYCGVVLLYGWPGTGKTRYVVENYPEYWESSIGNGTQWYDGYDGHSVVLFDDFAGKMSKVPLDVTLKLFDRYVRQVPVKGGHTWWHPNLIFVTTNIHPRKWYDWSERENQWPALIRRITHVYWYKRNGEVEEPEKSEFMNNEYDYDETDFFG